MNTPDNTEFETQLKQGALLLEEGRFSQALECFEQLVQQDSKAPAAHYFKGLALGNLEQHEAAAEAFKEALDLAPASLPILFNFAVSCLHTQRWQAALLSLTRYINYNPRGDEYRSYLLLGVASAQASELGEPLTFTDFLAYEKAHLKGDKYNLDLQEPIPMALLTLCFAALSLPEEQEKMLTDLRLRDAELAARIEAVLPDIAAWAMQNPSEEISEEPAVKLEVEPEPKPGADFAWESANGPLRDHLARMARLADNGDEPSPEALEELLLAFGDAYLLVPTEGEIENEGESPTFSVMLRPHAAFNNDLVGVIFTGVIEARAFFGAEHSLHRIVMPGVALAGMIADMNATLQEMDQVITAMIINPAGPHPYILRWSDLMNLAA